MITAIAATMIAAPPQVDLVRVWSATEKAAYDFQSRMQVDSRQAPYETFIPQTDIYTYSFTTAVEKMKPDGIADVRFTRPKIVVKVGETFESDPKDVTLVKDQIYLFTYSNKNQLLSVKDLSPKKPEKPKEGGGVPARWMGLGAAQIDIGAWIGQLHSLAAYVNFFDMGPNLPTKPVAVGDTWKDTVGYAPTTVSAGADKGKAVNARIDYVYKYMGNTTFEGKPYVHIQGTIDQDTDAAPYIAGLMGVKLELAPFKEIKLKMNGTVDYYLDTKTLQPIRILATSTGAASISVPQYTAGPVYEETFKSRASLTRR